MPSAPPPPVRAPSGSPGRTVPASEGIVVNRQFPLACSTFADYEELWNTDPALRGDRISTAVTTGECTVFGISTEIWWEGEERTVPGSAPGRGPVRLLRVSAEAGLSPLLGQPSRPAGRWWISVSGTSFE